MDLKQSHNLVLTDQVPINKSKLGPSSSLISCSTPSPTFSSGMFLSILRRKPLTGKLDDIRAIGWLDSMKSSSPPRKSLNKDISFDAATEETDAAYRNWLRRYPSALSSLGKIIRFASGKKIALFLDYDGTLSPIVDNPDHAFMSSAMRTTVKNVAKYFPTAIISGRSRDKVFEFVGLRELYYAGSHGMDLVGPVRDSGFALDYPKGTISTVEQRKEVNMFQPSSEFLPMINEVFCSLVENTKDIKGSKVENNKFCVSVHYRLVDQKSWPVIAQRVHDILKNYPHLHLTHGRKVLEIRPVINWNKGKAVEFLLETLEFNDSVAMLPIYVGDDSTDEDAFKVLREGKRGYGILVSSVPKETNAHYSLKDPSEVMELLKSLVRWNKIS